MSTNRYNWFSKNPSYSNKYCPYCGRLFSTFGSEHDIKIKTNKEHLIGRNFVPRNSFKNPNNINFIFRACNTCNTRKSNYERQVSSVSLLNSINEHSFEEQLRITEKANNDYSNSKKHTKVFNASSQISSKIDTNFFHLKLNFSAPPQVNEEIIANLAFMHMQGLIGFIFQDYENHTMNNYLHLSKKDFHYYSYFSNDDGEILALNI